MDSYKDLEWFLKKQGHKKKQGHVRTKINIFSAVRQASDALYITRSLQGDNTYLRAPSPKKSLWNINVSIMTALFLNPHKISPAISKEDEYMGKDISRSSHIQVMQIDQKDKFKCNCSKGILKSVALTYQINHQSGILIFLLTYFETIYFSSMILFCASRSVSSI